MKCVQCNVDNNLNDRFANQGRCKNCKHPFAFEPTKMDNIRFTDAFFAKALADISANDTLYFTPKQLLYLLEQRLGHVASGPGPGCYFYLIAIVGCSVLISIGQPLIAALSTSLAIFLGNQLDLWWSKRRTMQPKILINEITLTDTMVDTWLQQWQRFNPPPARLLPPPSATASLAPAAADDVKAYSFDRVLVCDSVAIAQLLIANNIHFEHNCAVFSITGYPQAIFASTMAMLRRNPDLQVIALHDCSPSGVALIKQLRTSPDWFLDSNQVIFDLGLLPRQIAAARGQAYVQISEKSARMGLFMTQKVRQLLTATELEWLKAGYFVDLQSFTPQKLMQIVSQGIAKIQNLGEAADSNFILVGDVGVSGGSFIYDSDNFG